ncbi:MAG: hypothetical protein MPJ50_17190 [Pirellulales bacterium]|nr:hypothetical protein [Pirellulales bacterium]
MNEQAADSELPVDYKGHDVIAAVRSHIPQFPIMVVTRATEDPDLTDHLGEADDIVSRADLLKDAGKYVARFVRHGMRYLEEHEKELAALADLSSKAASGSLTAAEIQKMKAIQTKLRLAASQSNERDRALQLLEKEVAGLGKIRNKLEKFLGEVGKKAAPKPAKKKPPKGSRKK